MDITVDYVRDNYCFGCKFAFLLPETQWTLMRRLGCKGAKHRIARLIKLAQSKIDDRDRELQLKDLEFARECLSEAILLGQDAEAKGWCDVAGTYNPPECHIPDEDARTRLEAEWAVVGKAASTTTQPKPKEDPIAERIKDFARACKQSAGGTQTFAN